MIQDNYIIDELLEEMIDGTLGAQSIHDDIFHSAQSEISDIQVEHMRFLSDVFKDAVIFGRKLPKEERKTDKRGIFKFVVYCENHWENIG